LPFIIIHNYFFIYFSGGWGTREQKYRMNLNDREASDRLSGEHAIQTVSEGARVETRARSPLKIKSMNLI
jgi:hypothetical protein